MRRTHILFAGVVVIAGAAALLGNRRGTSAEVQGAPLEARCEGALCGKPSQSVTPVAPVPIAPPAIAEIDLDRLALGPSGDHYEAPLKDGRRATLTLDPTLQAYAEKLLSEARAPRGAIVAMAPDGRILALAGRRGESPESSRRDTRKGTFDWRIATEVWAPAASVFKLVTASALVAAGVDPSDKVCYHGGIRSVTESNLRDTKNDSRCESLTYGVAHSNNAIVGKLAYQKLQPTSLLQFAHELGVNDGLPGADLHGPAGVVEIPPARDLAFAQTAAGFTGSQLSAVGGALLAATFADAGEQPIPRLIAAIDGVAQPAAAPRRALTADIARAVGRMMMATCEFGSAARSFGKHQAIRVAGKTGTLTRTEPFYMEHSWFVGYAPAEQPEIIVSVVLGNPENWHLRGHEAARRLIDRAIGTCRDGASGCEKHRTAKINSTRRVGW